MDNNRESSRSRHFALVLYQYLDISTKTQLLTIFEAVMVLQDLYLGNLKILTLADRLRSRFRARKSRQSRDLELARAVKVEISRFRDPVDCTSSPPNFDRVSDLVLCFGQHGVVSNGKLDHTSRSHGGLQRKIGLPNSLSWFGTGQGFVTEQFLNSLCPSSGFFKDDADGMVQQFQNVISQNQMLSIPMQFDNSRAWGRQPNPALLAQPTKKNTGKQRSATFTWFEIGKHEISRKLDRLDKIPDFGKSSKAILT
ncbi:hypothetical protein K438DRAFT_1771309 [Mycena galopus ATCC 62051]|nr:hypothetical protein K438DRAFT_1771309 [Mycena galopus ATCC 62051]